jgi:hypothetical protein
MILFATLLMAAQLRAAQPDACKVLTKADLQAVQGEPFAEAKLATRGGGTQCFYELPTFTKSVSVDVRYRGARKFWDETFEHERDGEEKDKKSAPPLKVRGLGSEAMWVSSHVAGSLYVRKGDKLLRVSVGGTGGPNEKLERSKRLALRALKKM